MSKSVVYKITNNINNKFYIGSAKDFKRRIGNHISALNRGTHYNKYLQRAWNKYGQSCFIISIVEECELEEQYVREQYYIDILNPIYNLSKFATGGNNGNYCVETIKSMSEKGKERWNNMSDDEKIIRSLKMREYRLGTKHTEETKKKISKAMTSEYTRSKRKLVINARKAEISRLAELLRLEKENF